MTYGSTICHPDEITMLIPKSSGRLSYRQYLIRITYGHFRILSGWLTILPYLIRMAKHHLNPKLSRWVSSWSYLIRITEEHCSMSSGWLVILPYDDLTIGSIPSGWHCSMSSGWYICHHMSSGWWLIWSLSHPRDCTIFSISSGWLNYCQYLIRMT